MPWVSRGLREGIVTSRYPRRPDGYGPEFRAAVAVVDPTAATARDRGDLQPVAESCPTGAIALEDGRVELDRGGCILCGRCVLARPDVFSFDPSIEVARIGRRLLVVPEDPEEPDHLSVLRDDLARRVRALRRSVHVRHVDCGSDGTAEWEIAALTNPVYDVQRLGIFFTASPRHADLLLVTGAGAAGMLGPLRRTLEAMADPKIVIAVGTDAASGGLLAGTYATRGGLSGEIAVDVFVPGSPPSPFSILHGILLGIGRLPARVEPSRTVT